MEKKPRVEFALSPCSESDSRFYPIVGTANSTSSGDLSPILPVSEPSTPVKTQNFLPRRTADKTSSEQSLVSIVKPVMSVKAAAVVHPEVVANVSFMSFLKSKLIPLFN